MGAKFLHFQKAKDVDIQTVKKNIAKMKSLEEAYNTYYNEDYVFRKKDGKIVAEKRNEKQIKQLRNKKKQELKKKKESKPKQTIQITIKFSYKVETDDEDIIRTHKGFFSFETRKKNKAIINAKINEYINDFEVDKAIQFNYDVKVIRSSITYAVDGLQNTNITDLTMFGEYVKYLGNKALEYIPLEADKNCVMDYLTSYYSKHEKNYIRQYTEEKIMEVIGKTKEEVLNGGFSDDDLTKWCDFSRQNAYGYDLMNKQIFSHIHSNKTKHLKSLFFVKANKHFYPIEDASIRKAYLNSMTNNFKAPPPKEKQTKTQQFLVLKPEEVNVNHLSMENVSIYVIGDNLNDTAKLLTNEGIMGSIYSHKGNVNKIVMENDLTIYANPDFHRCIAVANFYNISYENQSIPTLSSQISKKILGDFQESEVSDYMRKTLKNRQFKVSPLQYLKEQFNDKDNYSIGDFSKFYPACLIENTEPLPVFLKTDSIQEYDGKDITCGFYFVETDDTFLGGHKFYFSSLVKYALEEKLISKEQIKYQYKPSKTLPANFFNKFFIDIMNADFDEKTKKELMNSFIGQMNKDIITHNEKSIFVNNFAEACYYYFNYEAKAVETIDNGFFIHYWKQTVKETTNIPIHMVVMNNSRIQLHKAIKGMGGELIAIKTDCVVVKNGQHYNKPATLEHFGAFNKIDKLPKLKTIRPFHSLYSKFKKIEWKQKTFNNEKNKDWIKMVYPDVYDEDEVEETVYDNSFMLDCRGGFGKSHFLRQIMEDLKKRQMNFVALTFTHSAKNNLVCEGKVVGQTLKRFFLGDTVKYMNNNNVKVVVLDEISMIPSYYWKQIDELKKNFKKLIIIGCGDFNQLPPVEKSEVVIYDTDLLKNLFDCNEYKFNVYHRGDTIMKDILDKFLETKKIKLNNFGKKECNFCLCFTNKTRKELNFKIMNKIGKGKENIIIKQANNDHSQDLRVFKGLPVVCYKTFKAMKIFNNEEFIVEGWDNSNIKITDGEDIYNIDRQWFSYYFTAGYAITIHKSQGKTYDIDYTIYEREKLDDKLLYVALSRATDIKKINFYI